MKPISLLFSLSFAFLLSGCPLGGERPPSEASAPSIASIEGVESQQTSIIAAGGSFDPQSVPFSVNALVLTITGLVTIFIKRIKY